VTREDKNLEEVTVTGVAYDRNEAKVQILGVPDRPGVVARLFGALAARNVSVDMIIQNTSYTGAPGATDVTFTVSKTDLARTQGEIDAIVREIGAEGHRVDDDIVKVSIVGLGMRSHAGVAARMFELLAAENINIQAISTSEIKISCLIAARYTELAVRVLHDGFGLGEG
jgi:aspartate kinase